MSAGEDGVTMPDKPVPMVANGPAKEEKVFELLREAARVLPERFRDAPFPWVGYTYPHSWQVFMRGDWEAIWIKDDEVEWSPIWDLFLEAACREEVEARGWTWELERADNGSFYMATVWASLTAQGCHVNRGDAPAPAMLAALLRAAKAQP